MFGMGMTEILVILLVAALFLGPEKLPEAATKISKGIRDLRRQTRDFQSTIENDTEIGGAIRDLKSALRGEDVRRPPVRRPLSGESESTTAAAIAGAEASYLPAAAASGPGTGDELVTDDPAEAGLTVDGVVADPGPTVPATSGRASPGAPVELSLPPAVTLAVTVGSSDREPSPADDASEAAELSRLVRPAAGTIKRDDPRDDHGKRDDHGQA